MARLLAVVVPFLLAGVQQTSACSIQCREPYEQEPAFREARAVFTGIVVAREEKPFETVGGVGFDVTAELQVNHRWKGASTHHIALRSWFDPLCGNGAQFYVGEEYLVWAYDSEDEPGVLYAGPCTRTALVEYAADDLEFLGSPKTADNGGCQVGQAAACGWNSIVFFLLPILASFSMFHWRWPNKPLQPTRATSAFEPREAARCGPRG